jgi:hypothetical protein
VTHNGAFFIIHTTKKKKKNATFMTTRYTNGGVIPVVGVVAKSNQLKKVRNEDETRDET